jgi:hypothetical protein
VRRYTHDCMPLEWMGIWTIIELTKYPFPLARKCKIFSQAGFQKMSKLLLM